MAKSDDERRDRPDIEMGAVVKAKRLRFKRVPETDVDVGNDGESGSERENLPDEVEPGVTYRDVRVRWGAAARLHADVREDVRRRLD
jgi:hypothetical protein